MTKLFLTISILIVGSFVFTSCGAPATNNGGNSGNKPANASNTATVPVADKTASEGEIKKMLGDLSTALAKNDTDALAKIWGDTYMYVGPDGAVSTKAQRLEAFKTGTFKYESLALSDEAIRFNPENTAAIVIGKATVKGTNQGKPIEGDYRVTQVVVKGKDGWQVVTGQSTKIDASATAAKPEANKPAANTAANTAKPPAAPANK